MAFVEDLDKDDDVEGHKTHREQMVEGCRSPRFSPVETARKTAASAYPTSIERAKN